MCLTSLESLRFQVYIGANFIDRFYICGFTEATALNNEFIMFRSNDDMVSQFPNYDHHIVSE